ncbi:MAG: hypothetical protein JRF30_12470 [Deltaproteobacteria bacterium]|nr:hypothetical protein [Deltaproteobacteria bacterium]
MSNQDTKDNTLDVPISILGEIKNLRGDIDSVRDEIIPSCNHVIARSGARWQSIPLRLLHFVRNDSYKE